MALLRETIRQWLWQIARVMAPAPTLTAQTRQASQVMTDELDEHPEHHLLFIEFWMRASATRASAISSAPTGRRPGPCSLACWRN